MAPLDFDGKNRRTMWNLVLWLFSLCLVLIAGQRVVAEQRIWQLIGNSYQASHLGDRPTLWHLAGKAGALFTLSTVDIGYTPYWGLVRANRCLHVTREIATRGGLVIPLSFLPGMVESKRQNTLKEVSKVHIRSSSNEEFLTTWHEVKYMSIARKAFNWLLRWLVTFWVSGIYKSTVGHCVMVIWCHI